MADVKISALPVAASVALSDYVPCVVSGPTTKRATFTVVRAALLPIVLTADVSGTLPVGNGGTGITSLGTNVATFLGTPSGANLASALTSALPVSKGGTNYTALTSAMAALAIDWSLAPSFTKTLAAGGNTITFSNQVAGMTIVVRITGAASTLTWPTVKWPGGAAPTQTASGTDVYTFFYDGTSTYGSVVQAMA